MISGTSAPESGDDGSRRRSLRPRNIQQQDYNSSTINNGHTVVKKPENHFIVVFKERQQKKNASIDGQSDDSEFQEEIDEQHHPKPSIKQRSVSLDMTSPSLRVDVQPVRMRLLPSATLEKICSTQDKHLGVSGVSKSYFRSGESPLNRPPSHPMSVDRKEPELEQMDELTYTKYLDLIPSSTISRIPVGELRHSWPLRHHNRIHVDTRYHPYQRYQEPQSSTDERSQWLASLRQREPFIRGQKTPQIVVQQTSSNHLVMRPAAVVVNNFPICRPLTLIAEAQVPSPPNIDRQLKKRSASTSSIIPPPPPLTYCSNLVNNHTNLHPPTLKYHIIQDKELIIDGHRQYHAQNYSRNANAPLPLELRKSLLKKFINKYFLKPAQIYRPGVEMSSPLGRRLLDSYDSFLSIRSLSQIRKLIHAYERYCGTNLTIHRQFIQSVRAPFNSKVKVDFCLPSPAKGSVNCVTPRLLRSQNLINPSSNAWGLKSYHIYSFSRQERMEKSLTLMSGGLDWRGRLLKQEGDDGNKETTQVPPTKSTKDIKKTSKVEKLSQPPPKLVLPTFDEKNLGQDEEIDYDDMDGEEEDEYFQEADLTEQRGQGEEYGFEGDEEYALEQMDEEEEPFDQEVGDVIYSSRYHHQQMVEASRIPDEVVITEDDEDIIEEDEEERILDDEEGDQEVQPFMENEGACVIEDEEEEELVLIGNSSSNPRGEAGPPSDNNIVIEF